MNNKNKSMDIEKIKSRVVIDDNGCWVWNRSCNSAGYGQLTENKTYWQAHRYSYACTNTLKPTDIVRHLCHNPKCCNPEHLVVGTHKDNWHDSRDVHLAKSAKQRKNWTINGVKYDTVRNAQKETGISMNSLIKHTKNGIFNMESYIQGCRKANVNPKTPPKN